MIRDLMIGGASVEDTLTLWASSLRDVKQRIRRLFTQERVAASAGQFLDGLLGNEPRKTGWMRAEAAGDPGPWRQQAILGRGQWEADALRDIVCEYALETLADEDAVLVIDETGFLKQGKASCGVARQYTGSAGKITNCQIGVFAASMQKLVSVEGHRWAIEDSFETAKNELGLDHNESRSWHGWHRHVSLVMLAFSMMAVVRHRANTGQLSKKSDRGLDRSIVLDPLVDPGNPPRRHEACPAAHPARPYPRMVVLAQGSSGQRPQSPPQTQIATAMLGSAHRRPSRRTRSRTR
jgi:SRSO17 transposase